MWHTELCVVLNYEDLLLYYSHDSEFYNPIQLYRIGEELALALVDMRDHLGTDIMPLEKFSAFPRGRVGIGRKTLITSQYYEEIPYYGPPRSVKDGRKANEITKFYEWKVIACAKVRWTPIWSMNILSLAAISVLQQ